MKKVFSKQNLGLVLGPVAFLLLQTFFRPEGLSEEGIAVLASTAWIAIWWITEAIAIEATALLPLILFPLLGVASMEETGSAYGHKFIFLFLGGFILAIAIERWMLHKRIALLILRGVGSSLTRILLGFMLSTALLSMWISNTATTVMMLPIGLAVVSQLREVLPAQQAGPFQKALMLSIAYSASIGGMATLVGTPPNLVLAGVLEKLYGYEISFLQWFLYGLPLALLLLFLAWVYLAFFAFSLRGPALEGSRALLDRELAALGPMRTPEKRVLIIFLLTAGAWISRRFLLNELLPGLNDSIIALVAALILFIWPAGQRRARLLEWQEAVKLPWGVLLLFGGGIALAVGFANSGLAEWIGQQLHGLQGLPLLLLIFTVVALINFLTEITSNLATTTILLPILATLATVVGIHPLVLLAAATTAASCAFMLPVATPPNALVFGSGHIEMGDMVRTGVWLNFLSIFLLTLAAYFLLPLLWGLSVEGGL